MSTTFDEQMGLQLEKREATLKAAREELRHLVRATASGRKLDPQLLATALIAADVSQASFEEMVAVDAQRLACHDILQAAPAVAAEQQRVREQVSKLRVKRQQVTAPIDQEVRGCEMKLAELLDKDRRAVDATAYLRRTAPAYLLEREKEIKAQMAEKGQLRGELDLECTRLERQLPRLERQYREAKDDRRQSQGNIAHYKNVWEGTKSRVAEYRATLAAMAQESEAWIAALAEIESQKLTP